MPRPRVLLYLACAARLLAPLAATPAHAQTYNLLYSFTGSADGADPEDEMLRDTKGNLYGMTYDGGFSCTTAGSPADIGCGTVWKIDTLGNFSVLVTFKGKNGAIPTHLAMAGDMLYGATGYGGASDSGTLFKLKTDGKKFAILHQFDGSDGCDPGRPQIDAAGNVYDVVSCVAGNGGIVKVTTEGAFSMLFAEPGSPSTTVVHRIVLDSATNLIYTTASDATCTPQSLGCGTLFSLTTDGATNTQLFDFAKSKVGSLVAVTGLVGDSLYGLSFEGGESGDGALFTFNLRSNKPKIVCNFTAADGGSPYNYPIIGPGGTFYGSSFYGPTGGGSIYTVSKSGTLAQLHEFTNANGTEGDYPSGTIVYDNTSGVIYGTADYGGASGGSNNGCVRPDGTQINPYGCGTVYSLTK